MKNKLKRTWMMVLLALTLCGCGKKDAVQNTPVEATSAEEVATEEATSAEEKITSKDEVLEETVEMEEESQTEDSSDAIDEVYALAFETAMLEELENPRYGETELNYGYGFIDEDDIPELFIIRGTSHIDTVTVYRYDEKSGKAAYVGDFGGWGACEYVPHENKIISSYGNMGYFYSTVTKIGKNGKPELVDAILRNGGNRIESFYGFSMGNFTGAIDWEDYDINQFESPSEEYLISEEEADEIENEMCDGKIRVDTLFCQKYMKKN